MLRLGLIQLDVVLRFLKCMHKMELEQAKKTVRPLLNSLRALGWLKDSRSGRGEVLSDLTRSSY
jgi:hypothetical protein